MGVIKQMEQSSETIYFAAIYEDDAGEQYEVAFSRSYDCTIGYGTSELLSVQKDGNEIAEDASPWVQVEALMLDLV